MILNGFSFYYLLHSCTAQEADAVGCISSPLTRSRVAPNDCLASDPLLITDVGVSAKCSTGLGRRRGHIAMPQSPK